MTLLSKGDQEAVSAAINEVERETDAELVTVLTAQSDNYSYIPLLWAGILTLLVPGINTRLIPRQGFLDCIARCGKLLKDHIPATHERNELPNHLVILP